MTRGHVLVIPKQHTRNVLTMHPVEAAAVFAKAVELGQKIKSNLKADGMDIFMHSETAAHQVVMHTYIHLVPRYAGLDLYSKTNFEGIVEKIQRG